MHKSAGAVAVQGEGSPSGWQGKEKGGTVGKSKSKTVKVGYVCGNIGTHTPDSLPDAHAFEAISACTHETLPQLRLVKDLVIGKSGEVCSQPSYCRICRSRCTDCDLAQIVEERIGDLCPGEMTGVGSVDGTGLVVVELRALPRAPVDLPAGEA